jgi:hypothetical protein
MGRRIGMLALLVAAMSAVPQRSEASIIDFIWEMSGPRMLGLGYQCLVSVTGKVDQCGLNSAMMRYEPPQPADGRDVPPRRSAVPFFVLGATLFASTGHNSQSQGYDWGEIWMLAVEPALAVRTHNGENVRIHHSAGISYDLLFGRDIGAFDKFAIAVTPVEVAFRKRVSVGLKFRFYPHGTSNDEFKPGPLIKKDRAFESTWGLTFAVNLDRQCKC